MSAEDEFTVELAADDASAAPVALPDEEAVKAMWPGLAAMYASQPRLANALATARLDVQQSEDLVTVGFALTNEAQKNWIVEKKLRELEDRFQKLLSCTRVRLEPGVVPAEEQGQRIYMPVEKAQDLMSKNSEVSELIKDLALDIR